MCKIQVEPGIGDRDAPGKRTAILGTDHTLHLHTLDNPLQSLVCPSYMIYLGSVMQRALELDPTK